MLFSNIVACQYAAELKSGLICFGDPWLATSFTKILSSSIHTSARRVEYTVGEPEAFILD